MPYRGLEKRTDDALDVAELDEITREAKQRRRRAGFVIGSLVLGTMGIVVALAAGNRNRAMYQYCHHVEIAYENAPQLPHDGWDTCEWRPLNPTESTSKKK